MVGFPRVRTVAMLLCSITASFAIAADPPMPAEGPVWGGGSGGANVHAAVERGGTFACSPLARPGTAVIGSEIWDLVNRKPLDWHIDGQVADHALCAISIDARCFAAQTGTGHNEQESVGVWSLQTGLPTGSILAGGRDRHLDFIGFTGPDPKQPSKWLLALGPNNNPQKQPDWDKGRVDVWDWETGTIHHSFLTIGCAQRKAVLSPDGKYLAVCGNQHLYVYDVRAGREAAVMKDPVLPPDPDAPAPLQPVAKTDPAHPRPINPHARPLRAARGAEFSAYGSATGLSFSPDGRQLAGLFGWGPGRLIIWDPTGHVDYDSARHPLPGRMTQDRYNRGLIWSPDGTRLLLNGESLFDRKSEMVVFRRPITFGEDRLPVFLDDQTLLAVNGDTSVESVAIPNADIAKSLAALKDPATPAIIRPGQKVSLSFEIVGTARGDADKTREILTTAMTQALAREGLEVADAQSVEFHLSFEEAAGDSLEVYERSNPFDFRGKDTGRKATEAKSKLTVDMKSTASPDPIWSQELAGVSPRSINGSVDDNSLREAMLKTLASRLNSLEIPAFIPKGSDVKPLPISEPE